MIAEELDGTFGCREEMAVAEMAVAVKGWVLRARVWVDGERRLAESLDQTPGYAREAELTRVSVRILEADIERARHVHQFLCRMMAMTSLL